MDRPVYTHDCGTQPTPTETVTLLAAAAVAVETEMVLHNIN